MCTVLLILRIGYGIARQAISCSYVILCCHIPTCILRLPFRSSATRSLSVSNIRLAETVHRNSIGCIKSLDRCLCGRCRVPHAHVKDGSMDMYSTQGCSCGHVRRLLTMYHVSNFALIAKTVNTNSTQCTSYSQLHKPIICMFHVRFRNTLICAFA